MQRQHLLEYLDVTGSHAPLVLDNVLKRYSHGPRLASTTPSRNEVQLAREIIGCRRVGPLRRMFLEAKTLELVCSVLDHLSTPANDPVSIRLTGNDRRRLQQVRELLEANPMETARIEELTRQFGLNRNKLCTGFRVLFGVSIFDFASGLRMDEAQRLLRESQLTVSEIALAIGYSSAGAFSAAFHRRFGHSPTDLRRMQS
jgi:AraC-like DNA-binding protein